MIIGQTVEYYGVSRASTQKGVVEWIHAADGRISFLLRLDDGRFLDVFAANCTAVAPDTGWHRWADEQPDKARRVVYSDCSYDLILEWDENDWLDVSEGGEVAPTPGAMWCYLPELPS